MADAKRILISSLYMTNSVGMTAHTLNQSTDALEWIFQSDDGITITRLGFRQGVLTGTGCLHKISLQGVDASGNPDGTIKGGGSPASKTFTPVAGGNATWQWITLDNSYVCTRGEMLAIVIAYESGTIDASNACAFTQISSGGTTVFGFPYSIANEAGVRTRSATRPCFGYGSSSRAYGYPQSAANTNTFSASSTPDERALRFILPAAWGSTYKLLGVRIPMMFTAASTVTVSLYDGGGAADETVLQTVTRDTDAASAAGSSRWHELLFTEATLATLVYGNIYRIGVAPGALSLTLYGHGVAAQADWEAWPLGQECYQSTRVDGGDWTDDVLSRPGIDLLIADITGAGGFIIGG